ncbi:transglutaminase-like domain-containing protein [Ilumatobacter sp.]|uniref:transglutaminase-like domain-containing protein n=1 Tax=Ilumatobacter sp. TaxID=1967498 RepID=UPI003AF49F3C
MDVSRIRIGLTLVLGALLAVTAGGAFDELQWPLFAPLLFIGPTAALMTRQPVVARVFVAVVAVLAGVTLAVVMAGGVVGDVIEALVQGPRQLLTTEWPSPAVPTVVGAVALLTGGTTAIAADLAGRNRLHLAPLAVVVVGWAAALSIGAPVQPPGWVMVIGGATALALALVRVEGATPVTGLVRADRTVVVTVAAVAAAAIGTAGAVAWADRADPRQTEDAELNAAVLDPVEAMVALRDADRFELYAITDRSRVVGQSLPARWRIAALDTYDGQRWVPRLTLRPIGGRLGLPSPPSADLPPPISYALEYRSDDLDLLPFPGPPLSASVDVETDIDRVAVRPLERPTEGTVVIVESEVALTSRSSLIGPVASRQVDEIAAGFTEQADRLSGTGTVVERLRRIEATMRDEWQLDSETPGGGQQLALIERFVTDTNRGTEEQFVTAFVLMTRSLGFDARVATGFVVPPDVLVSPLPLDSKMASVWPEVRLTNVGWVAFDPVPSIEASEDDDQPPQPEAQTPAAAQPPIAPPTDDVDDVDDEVIEIEVGSSRWDVFRRWIVRGGAVASLAVLPFLLAIGTIIGLKWVRRRRRRRDPDPVRRIRGVWANATDSLVDAGLVIGPSWTDDRIAADGAELAPSVPHEMRRLAAMSTQVTFGPTEEAASLADDALLTSEAVDQAIRGARSRWQRITWRLSLRSLRQSTRSPVAPAA